MMQRPCLNYILPSETCYGRGVSKLHAIFHIPQERHPKPSMQGVADVDKSQNEDNGHGHKRATPYDKLATKCSNIEA